MQRVPRPAFAAIAAGLTAVLVAGCQQTASQPTDAATAAASAPPAGAPPANAVASRTNPYPQGITVDQLQAGINQINGNPQMTPQQKRQAIGILRSHMHQAAGAPAGAAAGAAPK